MTRFVILCIHFARVLIFIGLSFRFGGSTGSTRSHSTEGNDDNENQEDSGEFSHHFLVLCLVLYLADLISRSKSRFSPIPSNPDPSKMSLTERVHMFDTISTRRSPPVAPPRQSSRCFYSSMTVLKTKESSIAIAGWPLVSIS